MWRLLPTGCVGMYQEAKNHSFNRGSIRDPLIWAGCGGHIENAGALF